jgi:3-oxo-5-alpha-steroid 4-dehydrogenase 1
MANFYSYALIMIFGFAVLVFILLFFVTAPYGKFLRKGWGPVARSKWAWMGMEFLSPALIILFFITSGNKTIPLIIFVSLWLFHYIHRTFFYPFTQSGRNKSFPLILVLMALVFNCMNAFVNGYGIFHLKYYDLSWLTSWKFITGVIIFITGFIVNKVADEKLRSLRKESPNEYIIPEGWLFDYISSPHYFGEMIEWAGWAVMTWSLAGLAFFIFTFANLFPRAISTHRWYKSHFRGYPVNRKAVIPFLV